MAEEVHVHGGGGGNAAWAVTLVLVLLIALGVWFFYLRGGETREIHVDMNMHSEDTRGSGS